MYSYASRKAVTLTHCGMALINVAYSQIASPAGIWAGQPSLPGPSPSGQTTGFGRDCYRIWVGPGRASPNCPLEPVRIPPGARPGYARANMDQVSGVRSFAHTMGWSWASPGGARLGIDWASPCPDKSHSAQSCPHESRLGSERARYLGSMEPWLKTLYNV